MNEGAAAALCAPRQRGAESEPRSRATTINVKNGPGNRRIDGRRTALVWISQTASRQLLESYHCLALVELDRHILLNRPCHPSRLDEISSESDIWPAEQCCRLRSEPSLISRTIGTS